MKNLVFTLFALSAIVTGSCSQTNKPNTKDLANLMETKAENKVESESATNALNDKVPASVYDTLTVGGGCFWCVEAIYEMIEGVKSVESGYSGGSEKDATYSKVSSGTTQHAEVIQIVFDTTKVSIFEILEVFFSVHDPTTLNRQGADAGYQYRSVVFYSNEKQKEIVEGIIKDLEKNKIYKSPIVTKVSKFTAFYSAEKYHQDYYANNANTGYCEAVITPKIEKFKKVFKDKLKKGGK